MAIDSKCSPTETPPSSLGAPSGSISCSNARADTLATRLYRAHLAGGAKKVAISAPSDKAVDATIVYAASTVCSRRAPAREVTEQSAMDRITRMSDVALRGKRVFMRVDFNVPLAPDGERAGLQRVSRLRQVKWDVIARGCASLSVAILARPEPHRGAVQHAQGVPAQGGGTHNSLPAPTNRQIPVHPNRPRSAQLFQAQGMSECERNLR